MSILKSVTKGRRPKPRRTVLYGPHGIGKSTWASHWPNALFLPTEDGIADLDVASVPLITNAIEVLQVGLELSAPEASHDFKTIVLDSVDWLERLIWKDIVAEEGKENIQTINDIDYGKGHSRTAVRFEKILNVFDQCVSAGMNVVILSHCAITSFESPEGDSYDRYSPKLHKQSGALLQEWADEVLFASYRTFTRESDEGFNRKRNIGVGGQERILRTQERAGFLAKNRLGLPEEMPFDFAEYAKYLPGNISGAVVEGSSKPKTKAS